MGHLKRECRIWRRGQEKKSDGQNNDKENIATIVDGDMDIVYDESSANLTCYTRDLVIGSGASFYVTAHCDYFISYIDGDYCHIWIGNEGASKILGIWDIYIETRIHYKC